jgi:hypothetical protein
MSMHGSFIMIQGDHLESLPEVFSRFKYVPTSPPKLVKGWKETLEALKYPSKGKPRTIAYKAACFINNWTVIYDPEMLMVDDEIACSSVSNWLNTRVFGMICEGASNTYAYIFCNGNLKRSFWISDGEVFKVSGEKFPEEPATQNIDEPDVLEIMRRLGVSPEELEVVNDYYLYEFDESSMDASEPVNSVQSQSSKKKKPWWRFW